jgi:hypothetical protein
MQSDSQEGNEIMKSSGVSLQVVTVGVLILAGSPGALPVVAAVGSKQEAVVKKAMHGIYDDLKKLRLEFFQLRYIEKAKVNNNEFRYTTGLERDSRIDGPTFSKYGCDIYVHIQYPATKQDMEPHQLEGVLVSLKNGVSYAVWRNVRTEPTQEGQAFADKVNQIVTSRLEAMKRELEEE